MLLTKPQLEILFLLDNNPLPISFIQEIHMGARNHLSALINASMVTQSTIFSNDNIAYYALTRPGRVWLESHYANVESNFETHSE